MEGKELKKKIDKLWKSSKKDLDKALKKAERLAKEGEHYIKDKSEKAKKQLEIMALSLQREKIYYELGKTIAKLPKNKWATAKKTQGFLSKIRGINIKIGKIKKK